MLSAEIPANTTATIYIPVAGGDGVTENGQPVQVVGNEKGYVIVKVGSGKYEFTASYNDIILP